MTDVEEASSTSNYLPLTYRYSRDLLSKPGPPVWPRSVAPSKRRKRPNEIDIDVAVIPRRDRPVGLCTLVRVRTLPKYPTTEDSLVDQLKTSALPAVDDVADDLENYLETKERAEEFDVKIEQTDRLIDESVYERYE
ncbi:hypothetical protein [Halorubrum amylolyticum]|uniref:hypothetical protein n=1 Tax=Halorubrum amylolyticum TaxID=2508724 RepID=UPI001F50CDAB|nr:hypothetical protein [Halorubrum amylolyticum]